jgi:TctA family transporter
VPFQITGPIIALVCVIGAWTVAGAPFDLWLLLGFGAIGYLMKSLDYPIAPLVLAMVLGDRTEDAFRQSMLLSGGKLSVFVASPLPATITGLAALCLLAPVVGMALKNQRQKMPGRNHEDFFSHRLANRLQAQCIKVTTV